MKHFVFKQIAAVALGVWASVAGAIDIEEITSPGGIEAWLVHEPSIPFVAIEIRILGGTSLDQPERLGAGNLMMGLLEEGSGDMDALAFQEAREGLAASFGFSIYSDAVSISAQMLTENRDEAVALLRGALVEPRFDDDAVERVRAQVIAGIESDAKNPGRLASRSFFAAAYPGHPYGNPRSGTADSAAALTREDLIAAHSEMLVRDRITVGAVGDITAEELGLLLDTLLGDLPATGAAALPDHVDFALIGGMTLIDFPTPQSVAIFGHAGIARDHPDFFAAFILNHILGGDGFESRLMQEVREERGLTYGIGTNLLNFEHADMFMGSFASGNDRMAEAVEVVRAEWALMAEAGVTADELASAKTYLTGEYPLRFDGNAPIARIMAGMQMIGLGTEYITDRNSNIEAVTLEQINRVAAELLRPEALHFTIAGQPVGLTAGQ